MPEKIYKNIGAKKMFKNEKFIKNILNENDYYKNFYNDNKNKNVNELKEIENKYIKYLDNIFLYTNNENEIINNLYLIKNIIYKKENNLK